MADLTRYVNTSSSGGDGTTNNESGATAAYASLTAAEAGLQVTYGDLVADGNTMTILCSSGSGQGADTTNANIEGWTTDATRFITVQGNDGTGEYATSAWNATGYRHTPGTGTGIAVSQSYTRILGIQSYRSNFAGGSVTGIAVGVNGVNAVVRDCHVFWEGPLNQGTVDPRGIWLIAATSAAINNVVHIKGTVGTTDLDQLRGIHCSTGGFVYNNTVYLENVRSHDAVSSGIYLENVAGKARNNIVWVDDAGGSNPIECIGGVSADADYNAVTDTTAAGSNSRNSQTFTFTDAANEDLSLDAADTGAKGYGVDLSADADWPFSTDIDGNARSVWDIGASEVSLSILLAHYRFRNDDGNETGATWLAAEDVDVTVVPETELRVRVSINGVDAGAYQLEAAIDGTEEWFKVD